jgi:hypothetical protein
MNASCEDHQRAIMKRDRALMGCERAVVRPTMRHCYMASQIQLSIDINSNIYDDDIDALVNGNL